MQSTGEWLLQQETLVRDGRLLDVVLQHDRLQATLAQLLERLGLTRKARELDVASILQAYHEPTAPPSSGGQEPGAPLRRPVSRSDTRTA